MAEVQSTTGFAFRVKNREPDNKHHFFTSPKTLNPKPLNPLNPKPCAKARKLGPDRKVKEASNSGPKKAQAKRVPELRGFRGLGFRV